ncbi:hypothetical protein BH23CHL8_BH23CHL8_00710 [soil metagenome]
MDPASAFNAIADQGLAIVGVVALSVALWWLIRAYIDSLRADLLATRKELSEAVTGWRGQTTATDKLTDKLGDIEVKLSGVDVKLTLVETKLTQAEQRLLDRLTPTRGTRS